MSLTSNYIEGVCVNIQQRMAEYYLNGQFAPQNRRGNYGVVMATTSQLNRSYVQAPDFTGGGGDGKLRKVEFKYMQRRPKGTPTNTEKNLCDPAADPIWKSDLIEITRVSSDSIKLDFGQLKEFCEGRDYLIATSIEHIMHKLCADIDQTLISYIAALPNKKKGGTLFSATPYDLYDTTNERIKASQWASMLKDLNDTGVDNNVMLIGEGELTTLRIFRTTMGGMNTNTGINMPAIFNNVVEYRDDFTDTLLTPNNRCIIGLKPGAFQMFEWNRNPLVAVQIGSQEKGRYRDLVTGISFDMFVKYDDCDKDNSVTIVIEKHYQPYAIPSDSFGAGDELQDVNGIAVITTTL